MNNLVSIDARDTQLSPFNASRNGESNKPCFMSL